MMGFSRGVPDGPVIRQARRGNLGVFVAGLVAALLVLWWLGPPADAQNSAACEQYGCAEEPPLEKAVSAHDPTSASASASASASTVASDPAEASTPAVASPPPDSEPVTSAEGEAQLEGEDDASEKADGEATPDDPTAGNASVTKPPASKRPLPGYPYAGKPCEDRFCGLDSVEGPVECATYETASGEEVYGCADPRTFDKKGCYEITFYTQEGKPYSNLDTCSGERPYAPPEPPKGRFTYWEPPNTPRQPAYGSWMPLWDQCQKRNGAVDLHCGLEDIPRDWYCMVFYDTVHGTVRGCFDVRETLKYDSYCIKKLRLYDEAGRSLGTYRQCPKVREEYCAKDGCAVRKVPDEWWCRTEEWDYGELYGGERRVYTRCADPLADEYISMEIPPKPNKTCGILWDEQGRVIDSTGCGPGQGGPHIGYWAGKEAEEADDTLNGHDIPAASSGENNPPGDGPGSSGVPPEGAPRKQEGLVSMVVGTITDLLDGGSSPTYPQASPSATTERGTDEPEDTSAGDEPPGISDEQGDGGANSSASGVGSGSPGNKVDDISGSAGSLPAREVALAEIHHHGASAPEAEGNGNFGSLGSGSQDSEPAGGRWSAIPEGVRKTATSVAEAARTGGRLGTVGPLVGLVAVGGAFALRRRFFG